MESNRHEAVSSIASDPDEEEDEMFLLLHQLKVAVDAGKIPDVEQLLKTCESVNIDLAKMRVGGSRLTIFGYAIWSKCDPEVLKLLLGRANMGVNHQEELGDQHNDRCSFPLIHIAVYVCNFEAVTLLCDSPDLDLDLPHLRWDLTALHMSVRGGNAQIVNRILQKATERHGSPVLGDQDWSARFLNRRDYCGMTSLHHAAWEGHESIVARLLREDAIAVNAQDIHGFTPLHFASWNNHLEVVQRLLKHSRIDPQVHSERQLGFMGNSFVMDGIPRDTISTMIEHQESFFPSSRARQADCFPESVDQVRLKLEKRLASKLLRTFYPDKNHHNVTALHCAAFAGHSDIVGALVEAISRKARARKILNAVDDHLMTPLHYAIIGGDASTVDELLSSSMVRGNPEEVRCNLAPLDMTAILIDHTQDSYFVHEYKAIKSLLLGRSEVKEYVQSLYTDRQVFVDAANAILVGAALIASITFAGWLQPPLGYVDSFAAVEHHVSVEVFWIFNSFSFFFAVATVLTGAGAVLPSQDNFMKAEVEHIRILLIRTSLVLSISIFFVLGAFTAAGFASLPPTIKYQWGMLATSSIGCSVCVIVLGYYLRRVFRLLRRLVGPARAGLTGGVDAGIPGSVMSFVGKIAPYYSVVLGHQSETFVFEGESSFSYLLNVNGERSFSHKLQEKDKHSTDSSFSWTSTGPFPRTPSFSLTSTNPVPRITTSESL